MNWNKALVAGLMGALTGAALAYANAVPKVTKDEWWVISGALLTGFATGLVTYYTRNGGDDKEVEVRGGLDDLGTHTSRTVAALNTPPPVRRDDIGTANDPLAPQER